MRYIRYTNINNNSSDNTSIKAFNDATIFSSVNNLLGKWYQPRLSYPIIGVYFNEESGHSDSGSYCEVDLYWFEYEFYNWETFEIGEDQNGQTHYQSFKNHMCDDSDTNDVRRCTR